MNSLDEFLDHVDEWKFKVHKQLKRMTPLQRKAFFQQVREEARASGLKVVEADEEPKPAARRRRKTG